MRNSYISLAFVCASLIWHATALSGSSSGGVRLPVQRAKLNRQSKLQSRALKRRSANVVDIPLGYDEDWGLLVNVTIGSPGQAQQLELAIETADTWAISPELPACLKDNNCYYGTFDPGSSQTFKNLTNYPEFDFWYYSNQTTTGYYFTDTFQVGPDTLEDVTLALVTEFDWGTGENYPIGVLGLGPSLSESYAKISGNAPYPAILDIMKSTGHIDSLSYSLWFDQSNFDSGTLLLGGFDTDAYSDDLQVYNLATDPYSGLYDDLQLNLFSAVAYRNGTSITNDIDYTGLSAGLASDAYYTFLPQSMVGPIYKAFNVSISELYGPIVDCGLDNPNISTYILFSFSESEAVNSQGFDIPISAFLEPVILDNGTVLKFPETDKDVCYFSIVQGSSQYYVQLGWTIMHYLYMVIDFETQQIGLAKPVTLATGTDDNTIPDGGAVPTCVGPAGFCPSTTTTTYPTSYSLPSSLVSSSVSHPPKSVHASSTTAATSSKASATAAQTSSPARSLREQLSLVDHLGLAAMAVLALF